MGNSSAVSGATEGLAIHALATEAINIIADTVQDITDAIKKTLSQRDELMAMQINYYSNKNALDAVSNFLHAAYRRPSDRRRK